MNESVKKGFIKGLDGLLESGCVSGKNVPFWEILNQLIDAVPSESQGIGNIVFSGHLACWMTGQEVTSDVLSNEVSIFEDQSVFNNLKNIDCLSDAINFLRLLLIKNVVSLRVDYRIDPENNERCPNYHRCIFLDVVGGNK